jgi:glycosyltransferase involved in cell wall biosynthesis
MATSLPLRETPDLLNPVLPSVSVLMDVGNDESFLDAALASLARQTFADFEIILVENGSSAGVSAIARRWEEREPRLRVFRIDRLPIAQAHNFAARQARAPLLARLDSDDIALPNRLELQHRALTAAPELVLVGSAAQVIDASARVLCTLRYEQSDAEIRRALRSHCPFVHSATMIRADAFWRAGGYREGLSLSEDYEFYTRLVDQGTAANLDVPLVQYRIHGQALTSRRPHRMAMTSLCVIALQEARRRHLDEPFRGGTPRLRQAAHILGLSRAQVRRQIRASGWRILIGRRAFLLPLPVRIKSGFRRLALGLGLRRPYARLLQFGSVLGGRRSNDR